MYIINNAFLWKNQAYNPDMERTAMPLEKDIPEATLKSLENAGVIVKAVEKKSTPRKKAAVKAKEEISEDKPEAKKASTKNKK